MRQASDRCVAFSPRVSGKQQPLRRRVSDSSLPVTERDYQRARNGEPVGMGRPRNLSTHARSPSNPCLPTTEIMINDQYVTSPPEGGPVSYQRRTGSLENIGTLNLVC